MQLRADLERRILRGELAGKERSRVSAVRPGVVQALRRQPINYRQALGELESTGLIRREPGRGTFVATEASTKGLVLGLIYGGLGDNTFGRRSDAFGSVVGGIAEVADARGVALNPIPLRADLDLEATLTLPAVRGAHGLLLGMARSIDERVWRRSVAPECPSSSSSARVPESRASCVITDRRRSLCRGDRAFAPDLGHSRVGLLLGPMELCWASPRMGGRRHIAAHLEHGLTPTRS